MVATREPAEPRLPLPYPAGWERDVLLMDGLPIHIRPIRGADASALRDFHARLSPETVSLRFFAPHPQLSPAEVERFTHVDYMDRMALVAVAEDDLVAVARYDRVPGTRKAEAAFVVQDDHQGRGIATLLLEHLADYARGQGLEDFVANVLVHNRAMLEVFRNAGFRAAMALEAGVMEVTLPLTPTPEAQGAMDEREAQAEVASMTRLLKPRSVAVVGAGRHDGVGHQVVTNLLAAGFSGPVFPVNPRARSVAGLWAYPAIGSLPEPPDLVVVATPADQVAQVGDDAARSGAASLVVVSAGFAESGPGGARTERELVAQARGHGLRLVGPNCLGVANTDAAVRLNATFGPAGPLPGRVGLASQSGAIGIVALQETRQAGLGLSSFVSVGNQADVSVNDLLCYWEADPATEVVALYLESFGNGAKFARVARRVARHKPIVAIKAGRSRAGARGARSHTAAAATPEAVTAALLGQAGVIRAQSLEELVDVCRLLVRQPLPAGPRVALVGNSGGPLVLAADACHEAGLEVAELGQATHEALRRALPSPAAVGNPVDVTASASASQLTQALEATLADPGVDSVLAVLTPLLSLPVGDVLVALAGLGRASSKPVLLALLGTGEAPADPPPGAVVLASAERAAQALAKVSTYATWRRRGPGPAPQVSLAPAPARELVEKVLVSHPEGGWLDADQAGRLVSAYGVPLVPTTVVGGVEEAEQAAQALGYPVALKAGSGALVHKTQAGGVHLGLSSREELHRAYGDMVSELGDSMSVAVVQPMVGGGIETIVGLTQDASAGPVVMVGLGGVATDLLGDRAFGLPPLSEEEADELVGSLRAAPLLDGYRGAPAVDRAGLCRVVAHVARLGLELPEVAELDLNPVVVSGDGVAALDVKVRLRPRPVGPGPLLRHLG